MLIKFKIRLSLSRPAAFRHVRGCLINTLYISRNFFFVGIFFHEFNMSLFQNVALIFTFNFFV
jgi:hypothetical protein